MSRIQIVKPHPIGGFPELLPAEQVALDSAKELIRAAFERFGFVPIETPAVELKSIILAKGLRNDKQIYTVSRLQGERELQTELEKAITAVKEGVLESYLERYMSGAEGKDFNFDPSDTAEVKLLKVIEVFVKRVQTDMALHFDLTVPLARFVAQHAQSLAFPFRRYQIQKVWRGERQQSGRSREFYQCDIDVIGRHSLDIMHDAEIPSIIYQIFEKMNIGPFVIRISNTKVLDEYLRYAGIPDELVSRGKDIVDDMEKVGVGRTVQLLSELTGGQLEDARKIIEFLASEGQSNDQVIEKLKLLKVSDRFAAGVEELSTVVRGVSMFGVPDANFKVDLSIARGLDYYTGTVYETVLVDHPGIGSICSGGRYDDLASHYTTQKFPGVGISIGLTRLVSRLLSAGLVVAGQATTSAVLVTTTARQCLGQYVDMAHTLRVAGIGAEVYLDDDPIGRQLRYGAQKGFKIALVASEECLARGMVQIKNLTVGGGQEYPVVSLIDNVKYILDLIAREMRE